MTIPGKITDQISVKCATQNRTMRLNLKGRLYGDRRLCTGTIIRIHCKPQQLHIITAGITLQHVGLTKSNWREDR
ncbi:hypothetical protein F2P81_000725 [Scophthalmus maximus]|uniref:Uncharacterized protein n=1 Tax=Scophthalmus maximus TaxID=52904 RepID=A0A6A4TYF0_SCOMX|nr:hypothetical protein F2P81_000725 [Scophthalmus maximus]